MREKRHPTARLAQPPVLLLDGVFHGIGIVERQAIMRVLLFESQAQLSVFSTNTEADAAQLATHVVTLRDGVATLWRVG